MSDQAVPKEWLRPFPGPWRVEWDTDDSGQVVAASGRLVFGVETCEKDMPGIEDDYHLQHASIDLAILAPEMVEALEDLLRVTTGEHPEIGRARALLAKVRG